MSEPTRIRGTIVGPEPENETDHFMVCNACGQAFDMRDLDDVLYHEEVGHTPKPAQ